MNLINNIYLEQISGAGLTISGEDYSSEKRYSYVVYTMQYDGSMPPEFQKRIDEGESYHSMRSDLMTYNIHISIEKYYNPHLFV